MECAQCGKIIESKAVSDGNLLFCNNLCRHLWKDEGHSERNKETSTYDNDSGIFLKDLDFVIKYPQHENQTLLLRASFWKGCRLFLNGQELSPVKKKRFMKSAEFVFCDSQSNPVDVKLKFRPFDAIPDLIINEQKIEIAPPLSRLEYLFIFLPAVLLFFGGAIGGIIGGAMVFTNSILFRRLNHKAVRYSMVVLNTVFAFLIYYNVAVWFTLFVNEWDFKLSQDSSIVKNNPRLIPLTKHIWQTIKITNSQNQVLSIDGNPIFLSKRYFYGTGKVVTVMSDGVYMEGKWSTDPEGKNISIKVNGVDLCTEILSLTEKELIIRNQGSIIYHTAVW